MYLLYYMYLCTSASAPFTPTSLPPRRSFDSHQYYRTLCSMATKESCILLEVGAGGIHSATVHVRWRSICIASPCILLGSRRPEPASGPVTSGRQWKQIPTEIPGVNIALAGYAQPNRCGPCHWCIDNGQWGVKEGTRTDWTFVCVCNRLHEHGGR